MADIEVFTYMSELNRESPYRFTKDYHVRFITDGGLTFEVVLFGEGIKLRTPNGEPLVVHPRVANDIEVGAIPQVVLPQSARGTKKF